MSLPILIQFIPIFVDFTYILWSCSAIAKFPVTISCFPFWAVSFRKCRLCYLPCFMVFPYTLINKTLCITWHSFSSTLEFDYESKFWLYIIIRSTWIVVDTFFFFSKNKKRHYLKKYRAKKKKSSTKVALYFLYSCFRGWNHPCEYSIFTLK